MIIDDYTYCSIETVPNTHGPEWRGPCEQYSVFIQNYIYLSVIDLCRSTVKTHLIEGRHLIF